MVRAGWPSRSTARRYDFAALRDELRARAIRSPAAETPRSCSALYWTGETISRAVNGMFSWLRFWDSRRRNLSWRRDRLGKKPLYYFVRGLGASFRPPSSRRFSPMAASQGSWIRKPGPVPRLRVRSAPRHPARGPQAAAAHLAVLDGTAFDPPHSGRPPLPPGIIRSRGGSGAAARADRAVARSASSPTCGRGFLPGAWPRLHRRAVPAQVRCRRSPSASWGSFDESPGRGCRDRLDRQALAAAA